MEIRFQKMAYALVWLAGFVTLAGCDAGSSTVPNGLAPGYAAGTPAPAPNPTSAPLPITPPPTATPSPTPTARPTATPVPTPTATPRPTATPSPAPTSSPTPTARPTATPVPTPTATPSPSPTPSPTPTARPTTTPTPALTGSATITWSAPLARVDGTSASISEIGSYNIYYGTSPAALANVVRVTDAYKFTYTFASLALNTYYFVVTAVDSTGVESAYSNVVTRIVK